MGLPGMVVSATSAAAGAILYWAVAFQVTGYRISTVGLILMIAGAFGFIFSATVFASSRLHEKTGPHSWDRPITDSRGRSSSVRGEGT